MSVRAKELPETPQAFLSRAAEIGLGRAYGEVTNAGWGEAVSMIPPHCQDGVILWILYGFAPGSFLQAVISNDLFKALGRADVENIHSLKDYVTFFYNYAPSSCFGSALKYENWEARGGLIASMQEVSI